MRRYAMVKFLSSYTEKFKKLNRSVTPEGIAPHKPVLLLAVISTIAEGVITENVFPKQLLKSAFTRIWHALITTKHKCNLDSPFVALQSEGFWHIYRNKSKNDSGAAFLDDELYGYLQLENGRNVLIRTLLESYFWNIRGQWGKVFPELFKEVNIENDVYTNNDCARTGNDIKTTVEFGMLELAKALNVDTLPIPSKCLDALKNASVNSIADFCIYDLNGLKEVCGIGAKKASELFELQKMQRAVYKITNPVPTLDLELFASYGTNASAVSDQDRIEILPIPQSCITALNTLHVRTIRDFCMIDLNALIGVPGIGKRKISVLYDLQQDQRKIYGISKKLPPLNFVSKPSDSETSHPAEKTFHYPQTHLSFMSLPMREAMTPLDEDKTIADLALPITLKKLFQGLCLYDFDEIYSVGATCIEYFWRYLGNENFQQLIEHFSKRGLWKASKYQITSLGVIEDKWKKLFIARSLFSDEDFALLRRMNIVSWGDYETYITTYHEVSPEFLSVCKFHSENASKIKHFQSLLNDFSENSIDDLFFSSWDSKSRKIYTLRVYENKTLDEVASIVDLTRERVRQITKRMEEDIVISFPFSLPLDQYAALYLYVESLFESSRGIMHQETLFEHLTRDIDFATKDQCLILQFCKLNFNASIVNENIIFIQNECLTCKKLRDRLIKTFISKESLSFATQQQIAQSECKECLIGQHCVENFSIFLPAFYENNLSKEAIFDPQDKTLFSGKEYLMRRGSRREVVKTILSPDKKLSFVEIYNELLKYRADLGERQVYGYIQSSDAVLADRGVYMLASVLPSIPAELLKRIENSINQKLTSNPNTLLSLTLIVKKFHAELTALGCTTPYMLFEILKRAETTGIRYIKCPYVTSEKNSEKFSISDLLEDYIAENGRTALEKVRKDICSSAGVNEHVFTIAYANSEKLLVDDDDYLLSIDDLDISREILSPVITKLEQLAETAAITAKQLFDENKVLCVKLNILGPKLLFNILRLLESGNFIFRYPQISKSRENIVTIRQQVIEFIRATNSYCTADELNDFSSKNHLSSRHWYFPRTDYPELFRYLSGAWVHRETMGYSDDWANIVTNIAREVLDESTAPLKSYANLQEVCDREDDLPVLNNDLWWTPTLVAEILEESGAFLVYGKNKQFFSLKNTELSLNNFGDLCALLLEEEFGGAANLHEFSNYLRTKDLISNTDLHESLLQGSTRIIIDHHEVYVSEEAVLC